jgi:hypothetical protein
MSETREFGLGTVLTVTTGRLLAPIGNVYDILGWMTGEDLFTHQLIRAADVCTPVLLKAFPWLADVEVPEEGEGFDTEELVTGWLAEQAEKLGATFPVPKLPGGMYSHRHPLVELEEMLGGRDAPPVIPVNVGARPDNGGMGHDR